VVNWSSIYHPEAVTTAEGGSHGTQVVYGIAVDVVIHSVIYSVQEATDATAVTTVEQVGIVVTLVSVQDSTATPSTTVSYSVVTQYVTG
jgi:hypothetical protein